jgi:hypothetical protein
MRQACVFTSSSSMFRSPTSLFDNLNDSFAECA